MKILSMPLIIDSSLNLPKPNKINTNGLDFYSPLELAVASLYAIQNSIEINNLMEFFRSPKTDKNKLIFLASLLHITLLNDDGTIISLSIFELYNIKEYKKLFPFMELL